MYINLNNKVRILNGVHKNKTGKVIDTANTNTYTIQLDDKTTAEIKPQDLIPVFKAGDSVILHTNDQFNNATGTIESPVTHLTHVMEPRYVVRFKNPIYIDNDPTTIEQFRVSEIELTGV